jgi:hypothetical protein
VGDVLIEHIYIDSPASPETWTEHCSALATECGISAPEMHAALLAELQEIFGR